ncbi:hypothetical protein Tsubulata_032562 [Turnera subulata]|uniref:ornithine decarboxylase n=1 Tax=Turnera subulata TaxID=218843 RepID=A0A9Q0FV84_9ROSI|nr:hypothetical protein Tsubulata_032562 [Turnera subulata]
MGSSYHRKLQHLILNAPGVKGMKVTPLSRDDLRLTDLMQSIIFKAQEEDIKEPFYVLDLGVLVSSMDNWTRALPMVQPFYAVKCNPEPALLGSLAVLGSNFDCASRAEIESVLSLGVSPNRIIFAHPCKVESHIKYAARVGVNLTTFDSRDELEKIRRWHPKCALLIRIKAPDDGGARTPLGTKYGALPEEVEPLLEAAKAASLDVIGVSFHIGSGAGHARAYGAAIAEAKTVFDAATRLGMPEMRVLNIGGGFTPASQMFDHTTTTIREAIEAHFSNKSGIKVIAEPGRYFAEPGFTLATNIFGRRVRVELREYWCNDGVYGSLNCILNDPGFTVTCSPLACKSNHANPTCKGAGTYKSTVFGPTCCALDTILRAHMLPELQVGDWLVFPNMGAYTAALGTSFNGFNTGVIKTYLAYSNPES